MRILTRYVLFDLLKVFLLTLTGLTLLIFIVLIGKEAVDKGIASDPRAEESGHPSRSAIIHRPPHRVGSVV